MVNAAQRQKLFVIRGAQTSMNLNVCEKSFYSLNLDIKRICQIPLLLTAAAKITTCDRDATVQDIFVSFLELVFNIYYLIESEIHWLNEQGTRIYMRFQTENRY